MLDGIDSRKENIAYYDLVCKTFRSLHSSPQNYRAERKLRSLNHNLLFLCGKIVK